MNVAMCAHQFFGLIQDPEIASAIGKPNPPATRDGSPANTTALEPWSVADFSRYLSTLGLPGAGQVINVHQIVSAMERVGLLLPFGWDSRLPIMGQRYIAQGGASKGQLGGNLWLSLIFGAELIIPSYNAVTVQLAGNDRDGNPVDSWGTGLVIDHQHVITNKHVVTALVGAGGALSVHPSRNQGDVESVAGSVVAVPHPTLDVAVIKFDLPEGKLIPRVPGIGFRDPDWADEVYAFGYPRVPMTADMAITVQRGEVVNPAAETIPDRQKIFLYSAIARPGNSGGPIVAQDGRVIGLVVEDSAPCLRAGASGDDPPPLSSEQQLGHLADEVAELKAKAFAPSFYRGIPSSEIVRALDDLGFGGIIEMDTPL